MALTSGAHVTCGYVVDKYTARLFNPIWSETIEAGGVTSQMAPLDIPPEHRASLVFRVRAGSSGAMYAAGGVAPDATKAISTSRNSARQHLLADQEKDLPAEPGWKCQVVAA